VGELAALTAAFLWAAASILFARAGKTTGPVALNFVKTGCGLLMTFVTVLVLQDEIWPDLSPTDLGWLGFSGVLGLTVGDSAFFVAINRMGPRRAMLLWALVPPVTALLAWPVLGEVLGLWSMVGGAVTLAGVAWVLRERTPSAPVARNDLMVGLAFGLIAVVCQSVGSVTAKMAGEDLDGVTLSFVRLAFGTGGLLLQVIRQRYLGQVRTLLTTPRALARVVGATVIGTYLALWLSMIALQRSMAAVAATLAATSPIFVVPLARIFLKEALTWRGIFGATVAVVGVGILVWMG
jgi:drug/metabolite transporter (DMT)-like permease